MSWRGVIPRDASGTNPPPDRSPADIRHAWSRSMTKSAWIGLLGAVALAGCARTTSETAANTTPPTAPVRANPAVGGVPMPADRTIVTKTSAAPNLSTLVAAVKAAGLVETLSGPGPFTVFAPTDAAFARLAPGTVDTLLKPENKPALTKVLTYHVVPGTLSAADLTARITAGGGAATLTSVEGDPLTLTMTEGHVTITDVGGNKSYVETGDVRQSNGIVHVVNGVLVPKLG
jgi:uncharacterized surface protein with fasciclin (FAS1) repeats